MVCFAQSYKPLQISHITCVSLVFPFVALTKLELILESAGILQLHTTNGETELHDF